MPTLNPADFRSVKGTGSGRRYYNVNNPSETISQRQYREAKAGGLKVEGQIEQRRQLGIPDAKRLSKETVKIFQAKELAERKAKSKNPSKEKALTIREIQANKQYQKIFKDIKYSNVKKVKTPKAKRAAKLRRLRAFRDLDYITDEEYTRYASEE